MISKSNKLKEFKVEPIVRTTCMLVAQLMTYNEKNIKNLEIYCKQYLNELHQIDQKIKIMSNETDKKPIWMTQYNNLNVPVLFKNLKRGGKIGNF